MTVIYYEGVENFVGKGGESAGLQHFLLLFLQSFQETISLYLPIFS